MTYKTSDSTKTKIQTKLLARAIFRRFFWQGKVLPAFWTITGLISLLVNIILITMLLILGQQLFGLKQVVSEQLLTGLHDNFKQMDEAAIEQTIIVDDTIPVQFKLPVNKKTWVTLTEPTQINGAQVSIKTSVLNINAPADIILPKGTRLPIALDISVPVDTTVPVHLEVPVSIPLDETQLHDPFVGLQAVVEPYDSLLMSTPNSWDDTPLCQGILGFLCEWLLIPN